MSRSSPPPPADFPLAWFVAGVCAACGAIVWLVLGVAGEDASGAMPAWATLLYRVGGRNAVAGVFGAGAYLWACVALSERWPNVAAALLLVPCALAGGGLLVLAVGWTVVGAWSAWLLALLAPDLLPRRLRRVARAVAWFGGLVVGAAVAAWTGHLCSAVLAVALLAFGVWVACAPPTPVDDPTGTQGR
jgi:hypothetical protein